MKKKYLPYLFLLIATVVLFVFVLSHERIKSSHISEIFNHNEQVEHSDTITALIFCHAADYFVYQGSVIGFQYELLQQMAEDLKRPIKISVESDPEQAFIACFANNYDVIGFDFDKSMFAPEYLLISEPHSYTYPVLIMRKGMQADSVGINEVYTSEKYPAAVNFDILGNVGHWKLKSQYDVTTEDLFQMLEDTLIDYVVCNYNVAITMLPFYKSLSLGPAIGENFPRTWVLKGSNVALNDSINEWLSEFKKTPKYKKLCERYLSRHSYVIKNSFGTRRNKISSYDRCLKAACGRYNIDWRFMSSIIFQESNFSSDVLGMGGSFGIMQMMPSTCKMYGITDSSSVEQQIYAGAKFIRNLYGIFAQKVDSAEVYYFVAAAYNAGPGHILDAIALCKKHGDNAANWETVAKYLRLKSHKEYYGDPVVKCGYYPGNHTIHYVEDVMTRYNGYLITKQEK